jgi:hypothetical protein
MFSIENNVWFDIALLCALFGIGNILMGHFEERTPKWRRVSKLFVANVILVTIWMVFGRLIAWSVFGLLLLFVLYIHAVWLPKHGIHGWTGEPKDKYYELRGWSKNQEARESES